MMTQDGRDGILFLIGSFLVLGTSIAWAQPDRLTNQPSQLSVMYEQPPGRLTVEVTQQPLSAVLREIARQTGVQITTQPGLDIPITANFSNLPMEEGLTRLLRQTNYAMIYRSKADQPAVLERVQVLSLSKGVSAHVPSSMASSARSRSRPTFVPPPARVLSPEEVQKRREKRLEKLEEKRQKKEARAKQSSSLP